MQEFIIDRNKWRCGSSLNKNARGLGHTRLLNKEGFMCCLGQISLQIENVNIDRKGKPSNVCFSKENILVKVIYNNLGYIDTDLSINAMYINDNSYLTLKERERQLKELFLKHNIKLKFIGKSVKHKTE